MRTQTIEQQIRKMEPVSAPRESLSEIGHFARTLVESSTAADCKLVGPRGEMTVPETVYFALVRIAEVLARGDAITVVPVGQELTTQQAADILNVSRQYLVRLLDDGVIPHSKVGRHRRVRIEDVLTYKQNRKTERKTKLDKLAQLSQDFGGYAELK